ncbi:hypothetical protein ASF69_01585 [Rhizobium sp. Leaf311]|uniref:hypothetical protein n=1 Tax=Rhizobium sp. Leaf311 TaxID=1736332 RepID=UPI0007139790|nr:hypothetical protein [Rhizobium sp. Leaf311]KQQ61141.1 hypothetical protein ASF69_01585 [Rhizobium sp. Leaf311]
MSHHRAVTTSADENKWVYTFDRMIDSRNRLYEAITTLRDYATDLVTKTAEWVEPERGHVSQVQEVDALQSAVNPAAPFHQWAQDNIGILDHQSLAWIDKYAPVEPDNVLDEETLDAACNVVSHPFDAGKTLEQLGWSPPSEEPPDPPYGIMSREQAIMRMASLGGSGSQ